MNFQESLIDSTFEDVGNMMAGFASDDDLLEALFRAVKRFRSDLWLPLKQEFSDVSYFYEDSKNRFIAKLAKQCIRKIESVDVFEEIMSATGGQLDGIQLKKESQDQYVVFTPDAYTKGRFRYSEFDSNGFFGHCSRDSYEEALKEAISDGYKIEVHGVLEALFEGPYFCS